MHFIRFVSSFVKGSALKPALIVQPNTANLTVHPSRPPPRTPAQYPAPDNDFQTPFPKIPSPARRFSGQFRLVRTKQSSPIFLSAPPILAMPVGNWHRSEYHNHLFERAAGDGTEQHHRYRYSSLPVFPGPRHTSAFVDGSLPATLLLPPAAFGNDCRIAADREFVI